jgi:hypothetical protein
MSKKPMGQRVIRVSDELWTNAKAKADQREQVLSEEIRQFLMWYAAQTDEARPPLPRLPANLVGRVTPKWVGDHYEWEWLD